MSVQQEKAADSRAGKVSKKVSNKVVQLFRSNQYREEQAFLPAALEIQQTPPSPLGRVIMWVILLFFVLTFIWAWFGKIDIVATATGQLMPVGKSKIIQPLESGTIQKIHVKDGDLVAKGDLLVTLDATTNQAEVSKLTEQFEQFAFDIERIQLTLNYIHPDKLNSLITLPDSLDTSQQLLFQQQVMQFREKMAELSAMQQQYVTEKNASEDAQLKLQQTLPIVQQRLEAIEKMYQKSYASEEQLLAIKQDVIVQTQDLKIEGHNIRRSQALLQQVQSQKSALVSQTQQNLLQQLVDTQRQKKSLEQELVKAKQSQHYRVLKSPIDGEVQQLVLNTIGGVVTPAQELMVIVPNDQTIEVIADLLNKDIGFVTEEQKAEVKIDTFNFTKYGTIDAQVVNISDDAVEHPDLGWVYAMKLAILKNNVRVKNELVKLSPGMQVTVEVKTGKRRIIEYLLTPLLRYQNESIRER